MKVKISATLVDEFDLRELHKRADEDEAMRVYAKIHNAKSTRKNGAVMVEVTDVELKELFEEADSWCGEFDEYTMPRGAWMAYRALKKQCQSLMK